MLAEGTLPPQSLSGLPPVTGGLLPGQAAMQRLLVPWSTQQSTTSLLMQQLPMGMFVLTIIQCMFD